ncbi:phosphoribosyl transferase [Achromobacter spanius]|uniref:Phosphoribosyl transferase n=2 Tax=Achromobacter spanius TaxID=217203 RepID=A0A2S0IEJ2_9BURK|nr:ComF family protein [Achromobacter spanius]AVJ30451.1 phosphoribosyl transferase [Achromobacter spanius]
MGRRLLSGLGCDCPLCGARVAGARLCAGCQADILAGPEGAFARCPRCALRLQAGGQHCAACLADPQSFSRTVAAFDYAPPGDALVLMLKTQLRLSMAPVLARMMAQALREATGGADSVLPPDVVLVPIPASRASLRQRGMNPAAEIARSLAAELALPAPRLLLARRREAPRQSTLGRRARQRGAAGLFVCIGPVRGRHVAVVDDVMTTGSTVGAAAAALMAAGAASVTVLVAARTP